MLCLSGFELYSRWVALNGSRPYCLALCGGDSWNFLSQIPISRLTLGYRGGLLGAQISTCWRIFLKALDDVGHPYLGVKLLFS